MGMRVRLSPRLGLIAVIVLSGLSRWSAAGAPAFRFVHLSDTHCAHAKTNPRARYLFDPMAKNLVASFGLLEAAVRDINQKVKPDFVVVTGDLIDRPGDVASLRRVKRILDQLACPYYPVVGNHEGHTAWRAVFGAKSFNYVFRRSGWRFIAVDSSRHRIDGATRAWLTRQLDADRETPTALVTHFPLTLPKVHLAAAQRVYGAEVLLRNADSVRRLLEAHGNVRAALGGHCHVLTATRIRGIDYQTAPALVAVGHYYSVVAVGVATITATPRPVSLPGAPVPAAGGSRE